MVGAVCGEGASSHDGRPAPMTGMCPIQATTKVGEAERRAIVRGHATKERTGKPMSEAAAKTDRTAADCPRYDQRLVRRLRPTARWCHLPGPSNVDYASSVYEHPSGMRIHVGGELCRLPDSKTYAKPDYADRRRFGAHQPTKRRWMMLWAENLLYANTVVK